MRANVSERGRDQLPPEIAGARLGCEHEAERPVPGRGVVAPGNVRVPPAVDDEAGGIRARMFQIEPGRIAERRVSVGCGGAMVDVCDAGRDVDEVLRGHLHNRRFGHPTRVP